MKILKPEDFGLVRYVSIGYFISIVSHLGYSNIYLLLSHRLTGWNAVKSRVEQLGLELTDEQVYL